MSEAPRVLHLDDGPIWRGGQQQAWLLMNGLRARGVVQWLAARPGSPLALRAAEAGVEVIPFAYRGELDPFGPGRLRALARRLGASVLHAHTSHAHALALRAGRGLPSVRVLSTRRVDFAIRGFFSRRKYAAPGQHFIAISSAVREALLAGGVAPQRISLVHSGVPPLGAEALGREAARRALGIAQDELAIGNVGALTDHKGQRWLVEAAPHVLAAHPEARFHILGEGELRGELEAQIQRLGLGTRVRLHGHVPEARFKLTAFDLFVSSSHLEGLGTVILDAMQSGVPVIAARAGGVPEIVRDGQTGRLAKVADGPALATGILAALAAPSSTRQLAEQAAAMVTAEFSADAMTEGTLAVYREQLSQTSS